MEIKHTVEILTKDIQDIEKLVRNFNNYPTPPQIELDLAMDKLRKVYELLSMIASDAKAEIDLQTITPTETKIEEEVQQDIQAEESQQDFPQSIDSNVQEQTLDFADNFEDVNTEPESVGNETSELEEKIEENEVNTEADSPEVEEVILETNDQESKNLAEEKKASIVAEKFASNPSLNEKNALGKEKDVSSKISGEPIESIQRNIGINDRFLIIRELLAGNNEEFNIFIQKLDTCSNFNECFKLIESRFPDRLEHEGVKILINLSRRRFISSGNV
jgi:hypothetical protein